MLFALQRFEVKKQSLRLKQQEIAHRIKRWEQRSRPGPSCHLERYISPKAFPNTHYKQISECFMWIWAKFLPCPYPKTLIHPNAIKFQITIKNYLIVSLCGDYQPSNDSDRKPGQMGTSWSIGESIQYYKLNFNQLFRIISWWRMKLKLYYLQGQSAMDTSPLLFQFFVADASFDMKWSSYTLQTTKRNICPVISVV